MKGSQFGRLRESDLLHEGSSSRLCTNECDHKAVLLAGKMSSHPGSEDTAVEGGTNIGRDTNDGEASDGHDRRLRGVSGEATDNNLLLGPTCARDRCPPREFGADGRSFIGEAENDQGCKESMSRSDAKAGDDCSAPVSEAAVRDADVTEEENGGASRQDEHQWLEENKDGHEDYTSLAQLGYSEENRSAECDGEEVHEASHDPRQRLLQSSEEQGQPCLERKRDAYHPRTRHHGDIVDSSNMERLLDDVSDHEARPQLPLRREHFGTSDYDNVDNNVDVERQENDNQGHPSSGNIHGEEPFVAPSSSQYFAPRTSAAEDPPCDIDFEDSENGRVDSRASEEGRSIRRDKREVCNNNEDGEMEESIAEGRAHRRARKQRLKHFQMLIGQCLQDTDGHFTAANRAIRRIETEQKNMLEVESELGESLDRYGVHVRERTQLMQAQIHAAFTDSSCQVPTSRAREQDTTGDFSRPEGHSDNGDHKRSVPRHVTDSGDEEKRNEDHNFELVNNDRDPVKSRSTGSFGSNGKRPRWNSSTNGDVIGMSGDGSTSSRDFIGARGLGCR